MIALRKLWLRVCVVLTLGLLSSSKALAVYTAYTAPATVDDMFDGFDVLIANFSVLFGVAVVLCVLVTGFYLGRKWLKRVG